jgi:8-oxo-dGTP pyrophosphatase MutT (NUDIX family)
MDVGKSTWALTDAAALTTPRVVNTMLEIRSAARLLLVDATGRVLLFRHNDGHGREFWATPGGGIEPGETAEQAARREAREELGTADVELVPLWTGHTEFTFATRRVSQTETYFMVTRHSEVLLRDVHELHRLEGITEIRWWSLDDIDATEEPVFPRDLAARVRAVANAKRGKS